MKFTERGEIRLVSELLERTGDKVKLRFSVKDTGIGMTKEQASRLFQAFAQSRCFDVAQIWRDRIGPGDLQAPSGADGRLDLGCQ